MVIGGKGVGETPRYRHRTVFRRQVGPESRCSYAVFMTDIWLVFCQRQRQSHDAEDDQYAVVEQHSSLMGRPRV